MEYVTEPTTSTITVKKKTQGSNSGYQQHLNYLTNQPQKSQIRGNKEEVLEKATKLNQYFESQLSKSERKINTTESFNDPN